MINKKQRQKFRGYLDESTTQVNRRIDSEFYEDDDHLDNDLYNMGGNTPLLNENTTDTEGNAPKTDKE